MMPSKEIRRIKIIADFLLISYGYFMFSRTSSGLGFYVVTFFLLVSSVFLRDLLPQENRLGATFLKRKYRFLEFSFELIVIFGMIWLLVKIS
ncbi:hypothetical protein NRIC_07930 [Enterococcus florum]|uniref:Uncharacterized protein n=1 Tax=Enterococcus florum TaxID=2480627 RepID=A0A4P5PBT8_9ENTE|nr:hypothetical protein NRIC_07930 [Enterococcus florum]